MTTEGNSFFAATSFVPPDAIFELTARYLKDSFAQKVNLGQGTYRDGNGQPWVLPSVSASREALRNEGLLHEYLPILGLPSFRQAAARLVLGSDNFDSLETKVATCQSISGTGALHLAGLFLRRCFQNQPRVYVSDPSWSNHVQVFSSLGYDCHQFRYYDATERRLDIDAYVQALQSMTPGSIVILHACAHNPTGCDPTPDEWRIIGNIIKERGLFPLFDAAYLGFNSGSVDRDAWAIRYFVNELSLECAICVSFAKNMGLYGVLNAPTVDSSACCRDQATAADMTIGERTGCTIVVTQTESLAVNSQSMLEMLQRSEVSNPPAYGAKIAGKILNDPDLYKAWQQDLITMSSRIRQMRETLYTHLQEFGAPGNWDHLIQQTGMFGFLGLARHIVLELKERYHIYMAENSRVSIAGLNEHNVVYVARSIAECLKQQDASTPLEASL